MFLTNLCKRRRVEVRPLLATAFAQYPDVFMTHMLPFLDLDDLFEFAECFKLTTRQKQRLRFLLALRRGWRLPKIIQVNTWILEKAQAITMDARGVIRSRLRDWMEHFDAHTGGERLARRCEVYHPEYIKNVQMVDDFNIDVEYLLRSVPGYYYVHQLPWGYGFVDPVEGGRPCVYQSTHYDMIFNQRVDDYMEDLLIVPSEQLLDYITQDVACEPHRCPILATPFPFDHARRRLRSYAAGERKEWVHDAIEHPTGLFRVGFKTTRFHSKKALANQAFLVQDVDNEHLFAFGGHHDSYLRNTQYPMTAQLKFLQEFYCDSADDAETVAFPCSCCSPGGHCHHVPSDLDSEEL